MVTYNIKFIFILTCSLVILLVNLPPTLSYEHYNAVVEKNVYDELKIRNYTDVIIILNKKSEVLNKISEDDFLPYNIYEDTLWAFGKVNKVGLDRLVKDESVVKIYKPSYAYPLLTESVPLINSTHIWGKQLLGINITGSGQVICIVDSGVNASHPDLNSKVIYQVCFCNISGVGCCPNGQANDTSALDEYGHGTRVAGVITANGNLLGVAPDSKIVAVRVTNSTGGASETSFADGIRWCKQNKETYNITIISISYGLYKSYSSFCDDEALSREINDAVYNYSLFVSVASGNLGNKTSVSVPACASYATSVGATYDGWYSLWAWGQANCSDGYGTKYGICCGSNRGEILSLLSPGCEINSTNNNGDYYADCGTSFSAPHVAGAAALFIQYEKLKNNRTPTPIEIRQRFMDTGELIFDNYNSTNSGNGSGLTFPRIDVYAAIFPIDVYDFQRISASNTHNIFSFKIKNNYNNQTKNVSWSFDIGNGTLVSSQYVITLPPKNSSFVFFEQNYTDGDIYYLNATATSGGDSDSELMTLTLGDIIAYDLREIYVNGRERVFTFRIMNNMNATKAVNWTFSTGQQVIHASQLTTLQPGNQTLVYFHYNYTAAGNYTVNATAMNGTISDATRALYINVP